MKKVFLMFLAAGAMVFSACNEDTGTSRETNENDSQTKDEAAGDSEDSTASTQSSETTAYNYEGEYQERANRMASQVSSDMRLDTATQARLRAVYYNRARQIAELNTRYSSTNASAGSAEESSTDVDVTPDVSSPEYPAAYYEEMETINSTVDKDLQTVFTPVQFKTYGVKRQQYYDMDMKYKAANGDKLKIDGDEAKLKTDDRKVKVDGDEAKVKTDNMKKKIDGDESKTKMGDTKIKRDGNESKIKSGDTKIKIDD